MPDLNDYALFAAVAAHGGFAPAGRALKAPKSTLSRRIAGLEARLGVRLIERSTRRFRLTDVGRDFYERCRAVLLEVERAEAVVADAQGEAKGLVRCSCPLGLVETFSPVFTAFMARYPKVLLQIVAADRAVDLIEERIDVAVRVRLALLTDAALTMRTLGRSARILVAAPAMAEACKDFGDLDGLPTLSSTDQIGERTWSLNGPEGETRTLHHTPRMSCADFPALRLAAASGLGVALLPDHVCTADLESGRLARVLPQWRTDEAIVHLVFTTRRGLPPAVRALIDYLAGAFRQAG